MIRNQQTFKLKLFQQISHNFTMVNLFYTGCPKNMTVGRRFEDRFQSLKSFAAFIRQLNFRSRTYDNNSRFPVRPWTVK